MSSLFLGSGVGPTIMYLALACLIGLLLGQIKIKGVSLGITWVLFVGILISALGITLNAEMLHVVKELGLMLFVMAVGFQVGPTFFSSFKSGGLALNLCAVAIVALGVVTTIVISKTTGESLAEMTGVYTGAITNTPGMSAAQQVASETGATSPATIANGYAVAYPLGVVGLILSCLIVKWVCRIRIDEEPTTEKRIVETPHKSDDNSGKSQRHKNLLWPIFLTLVLGIILGSIPIPVGFSVPVKLGLAGGPLVVAILVSWLGTNKGWLSEEFTGSHGVWLMRELGILLFLAAVGLSAGQGFVQTLQNGGYMWIVYGILITMIPVLIVAFFARCVLKVNYFTLMGVIAGSTTDPPTLAFANTSAPEKCKLPATGYATVYPLTMFLRIFTAQLLILLAI